MTRLFTTGAETGQTEWNGASSSGSLAPQASSSYYRTGSYSWLFPAVGTVNPSYFREVFQDSQTELYGRFALYLDSDASQRDIKIVQFCDQNNALQVYIRYDMGTQTLEWRNGNDVLLGPGTVLVPANTWTVIEFHVVVGSSGSLILKINSSTAASFSGDTDHTNAGDVRSMYFGSVPLSGSLSGFVKVYLDDIGINNVDGLHQSSWVGLGGCFLQKPMADGSHLDWTPSEGTDHYDDVDETPPNTTDWVQAVALGDIDTYGIEDCPPYIDVINLVQVLFRAAVITSGSNTLEDVIRQGGVDYNGLSHVVVPLIPAYTLYKGETHYVQPDGSGVWTIGAVDALEVGMEIVA